MAAPGVDLRVATDADLPLVVPLARAAVDHEVLDTDDLAFVLAQDPPAGQLDRPGRGPTLGIVAETPTGDLVGAAYGAVRTGEGQDPSGAITLLVVHPKHRDRGLGRTLLGAIEDRLVAAGATTLEAGPAVPRYLWPGVDVRATPLLCLLEASGYRRGEQVVNMTVDLLAADLATAVDEERLAGGGIIVRALAEPDLPAFGRFMQRWDAAWHAEAVAGMRRGGSCHVAWRDEDVIGFAAAGGVRRSFFGPMGTAEEARGTGVGRVLLRRCLRDLRDGGLVSAEVAWAGPLRFYSRAVGARVERVCWQVSKPIS